MHNSKSDMHIIYVKLSVEWKCSCKFYMMEFCKKNCHEIMMIKYGRLEWIDRLEGIRCLVVFYYEFSGSMFYV